MGAGGWIAIGLVVVIAAWAIVIYNGLVALRNRFKNAFAQIDVQLKRRYDLIPNLVEAVKGYLAHERQTLEAVIAADPEAQAPYTVLGDYWSARGDVRGELIVIGHALAKNPTHKVMRTRWTQLFEAHAAAIWGDLDGVSRTIRYVGKGKVVWGRMLDLDGDRPLVGRPVA